MPGLAIIKIFRFFDARILSLVCLILFCVYPGVLSQKVSKQELHYTIDVKLCDRLHELRAFLEIEYVNNSPDSLNFICFRLAPNAYCSRDSLDFKVDNQGVRWILMQDFPEICKVFLNKTMEAGDTLFISTPFHIKIPHSGTSSFSHKAEYYQLSQWYPKPVAYDCHGWQETSIPEQCMFNPELGDYNVSITLPANYIVAASGKLQTESEAVWLDQLSNDSSWMSTLSYGKPAFPPSSEQKKTLRFTGTNLCDFAWCADKRYHVLKGKTMLQGSGLEVTTTGMFTNEQKSLWKKSIGYMDDALTYFSEKIGDYPYPQFTAVQNTSVVYPGLEFPGIAVLGKMTDAHSFEESLAKAIASNWFSNASGPCGQQYPFMDEGIASYYTGRYMEEKYPGKYLWEVYIKRRDLANFYKLDKMPERRMQELLCLSYARENLEQAIKLPDTAYTASMYNVIIHEKTAMGFNYLKAYLGESVFDAAMQNYYQEWKFKQPYPEDLRSSFESSTGKDLGWFFEDLIATTKRLDYKIARIEKQKLLVRNKAELASPLLVAGLRDDSLCFELWVDGFAGEKWIDLPEEDITEVKIDPDHEMPEIYRLNNNIKTSKGFSKADPLQLQLSASIVETDKRELNYLPLANRTEGNGFMLGVLLNNGFIIPKRFHYYVLPQYSFNRAMLGGFGKILYHITPYDKFIRKATASLEGARSGAPGNNKYHKLKAGLEVNFSKRLWNSTVAHGLSGSYTLATDLYEIEQQNAPGINPFFRFEYWWNRTGSRHPFILSTYFESGKSFHKTSLEFSFKHNYFARNKSLGIRLFAGAMLKENPDMPFYGFAASGRSSQEQYLYENELSDCFGPYTSSFLSRQMAFSEGGLASPVNSDLGYSSRIVSLSMTSSLPWLSSRIDIKPFANILLSDRGSGSGFESHLFCEIGLRAGLLKYFEVYVPLLVTNNIQSMTGSFSSRIRFVLKLKSFRQLIIDTGIGFQNWN